MTRTLVFNFVVFFAFTSFTQAQPRADDRDLSGSHPRSAVRSGNLIKPDHVEDGATTTGLSIQFVRRVKDVEVPVEGLAFGSYRSNEQGIVTDRKCKTPTYSANIPLKSTRYHVGPGPSDYQLFLSVKCGVTQKVVFDEKSDNGQPIAIWQAAVKAEKKLSKEVGLKFWSKPIAFIWPSDGDYYNDNEVNLTLAYQWDVVTHELGHAIYDQADLGFMGSGEHYIDRCYDGTLAFSEGWASFFSAWVNLDLADPNAHFEYMVPRRAPLGVENVPSDVCGNPTNEWRVYAFLWDLIDTHDDGETFAAPFSKLWKDSVGAHASSLEEVKQRLIQKGWDSDSLQTIWKLNFPGESASLTR
jgi:hypothetical protein